MEVTMELLLGCLEAFCEDHFWGAFCKSMRSKAVYLSCQALLAGLFELYKRRSHGAKHWWEEERLFCCYDEPQDFEI
jgi:hypothetical protein